MTPVTPYLSRAALALMAGALAATVMVTVAPGTYYDLTEWHLVEPDGLPLSLPHAVTVGGTVADLLMAAVVFLVGKEGWEALTHERAGMSGRRALLPMLAAFGGMAGAAVVWLTLSALFETAEEAAGAPGWLVPMGGDVALVYLFAPRIFGRGHPALQLLLFVAVAQMLTALVLTGLVVRPPEAAHLGFALLSLAAAGGWLALTRPASQPGATEVQRHRANAVGPWIVLAGISWVGVALAGLPPALGFLPVLPAMPQASRSFGLFAVAEGFLTDPANRLAHRLLPAMMAIMFLFGMMAGGIDVGALAPTTWITLGALWIGKPLGFLAVAAVGLRVMPGGLARGLTGGDLWRIGALTGISFTGPALVMAAALPGGGMQEAARIGLALAVIAGPALVLATAPPRRRGALPPHA